MNGVLCAVDDCLRPVVEVEEELAARHATTLAVNGRGSYLVQAILQAACSHVSSEVRGLDGVVCLRVDERPPLISFAAADERLELEDAVLIEPRNAVRERGCPAREGRLLRELQLLRGSHSVCVEVSENPLPNLHGSVPSAAAQPIALQDALIPRLHARRIEAAGCASRSPAVLAVRHESLGRVAQYEREVRPVAVSVVGDALVPLEAVLLLFLACHEALVVVDMAAWSRVEGLCTSWVVKTALGL